MKCKNIECSNDVINNRIYCSMSCRSIYVNKYIRKTDKISKTFLNKKKEKEKEYLKNPKLCRQCREIIPYAKKINNYCNQSCANSYTNSLRKGIKYNLSEEGLNNILKANYLRTNFENKNECIICNNLTNNKKFCSKHCQNKLNKEKISECFNCNNLTNNKKFCCKQCQSDYYITSNKDNIKKLYNLYKNSAKFNFNLSDYESEFDFLLIKKYGWYSPSNIKNNLNGVSRDHMLSVKEGFELEIDPKLLAHPANCKLMRHKDNALKSKSSSITYEELLERIKYFNEKYNLVDSSGNRTQ